MRQTPALSDSQLRKILFRLAQKGGGQKALAKNLGVSASYLNDVMRERRDPGYKLLDALGLERVVSYRPKAVV